MPPRRRQPAASDPPPPLPGGYKVGEKVFFTAASQTLSPGDKVVHGQQGEVTGPATLEGYIGKGVNVRFPGNKGLVACWLTHVRRLRAAPAATPPACAPHARRSPRPVRSRDSLCRSAPALTACAAARAATHARVLD